MDELRQRLRTAFAHGTAEELAACLGLIFKLSFSPSNKTAAVDFHTDHGRQKVSDANPKLDI